MPYYRAPDDEDTEDDSGGGGICAQDNNYGTCQPSAIARPTRFCKRFASNISAHLLKQDKFTGIRRKVIYPFLDDEVCLRKGDAEDATEDFGQTAMCGDERYKGLKFDIGSLRGMPWSTCPPVNEDVCSGGLPNSISPNDDPATKLRKLICQEADEIDSSNAYLDRAGEVLNKQRRGFQELQAQYQTKYDGDESFMDSELEPELAAALLQSEEQGAALKHIPPASLFGRLFPEDRSKPRIRVAAASKRRREMVLPTREGLQREEGFLDDVDAGIVDFFNINDVDESRHIALAQQPIPEHIKDDMEGTSDQVFGLQSGSNDQEQVRKPFKYVVTSEPPMYGSYAQLRGSEPPRWFPGFFTVQPGTAALFKLNDPFESLEKAWSSMGPTQVDSPYGSVLLGKP